MTRAVETLAKQQYTRSRDKVITNFQIEEDQIPTWEELDAMSTLIIKEEALSDLEKITPFVEQEVLSTLATDERFGYEAAILINDLAINKGLEILTENM